MPKKKQTRKNRRGKRKGTAGRPDRPVQPPITSAVQRAGRQALAAGILLEGLENPDVAWRAFNQAMSYEIWLQAGRPIEEANLEDWPAAYHAFMEEWPEAFEYYRHHLFAHLSWGLRLSPWGEILRSLMQRMRAADPSGFEEFRTTLEGAEERFQRQRDNAQQLVLAAASGESEDLNLVVSLSVYSALYEIDLPLWLLGVVAKATQSGQVRADYLGGPETTTHQRSLADAVAADLEGTPLQHPFSLAYDPVLRNAIAHNDWEVRLGRGRAYEVIDHRTGSTWSDDEAWDRIVAAQAMHHAVILVAQLTISGQLQDPQEFVDVGVLSFTSWLVEGEIPALVVPQLWCFRDLDPLGEWIDNCSLTMTASDGEHDGSTSLTPNATSHGSRRPQDLEPFRDWGWARIVRIPVAPPIGRGLPTITTTQGETFEVVGVPDEHVVPVKVG